jgi:hypothetical protein
LPDPFTRLSFLDGFFPRFESRLATGPSWLVTLCILGKGRRAEQKHEYAKANNLQNLIDHLGIITLRPMQKYAEKQGKIIKI